MTRKVLLTGRPGCGKTTLIKRVVNELARPAGGFYTEEIRERGARVGFKIVTLAGEETVLSHVDFKIANRIGKYRLDLSGLETIGVAALRRAVAARHLVVIDEIGPMEIRSRVFCDAVKEALDINVPVLGTISVRPNPFTNAIKNRRDVTIIEVSSEQSRPTRIRLVRPIQSVKRKSKAVRRRPAFQKHFVQNSFSRQLSECELVLASLSPCASKLNEPVAFRNPVPTVFNLASPEV